MDEASAFDFAHGMLGNGSLERLDLSHNSLRLDTYAKMQSRYRADIEPMNSRPYNRCSADAQSYSRCRADAAPMHSVLGTAVHSGAKRFLALLF